MTTAGRCRVCGHGPEYHSTALGCIARDLGRDCECPGQPAAPAPSPLLSPWGRET